MKKVGSLCSPVPKLEYQIIEEASTKPEAVISMVRVGDTVVIKKANGRITVLKQIETQSFNKGAYTCQVWHGLQNVLKCVLKLGIISKEEYKTHIDAANQTEIPKLIKEHIRQIKEFGTKFNINVNRTIKSAETGKFIKEEDLYR